MLLKTQKTVASPMQKLVRFLVRGHKLSPQQGAEIMHHIENNTLKLRNELKYKEYIGKAFSGENSPNVTAYVNGLGTVNRVVVDESLSKLSKNRLESFIVSAVAKALKQPKDFVDQHMKNINNEAMSLLYNALESYNSKLDSLTDDYNPILRQAYINDQLYANALYQQVLEESFKPEGYLHEDEELLYIEKKKQGLSEREMDNIMLGDKVPDSSLL